MTMSTAHRSQWDPYGELWAVVDTGASFATYGPDGTLTSATGCFDGATP
ncbi:MAG: hypothetical protein ACE37B_12260 [Ilumatobacter sp.]